MIRSFFQNCRIIMYRILSDNRNVAGEPRHVQPVLFSGKGTVRIGKNVTLGFSPSPYLYSGYIHIEARGEGTVIEIGDNVCLNNNCVLCSEGEGITIGSDTVAGSNVQIYDSDFHELDPGRRKSGTPATAKVSIGSNVFIGANVTILKGVSIGSNSVIGNGAVVVKSVPDNVIAAGNPCAVIRSLCP